MPRKVSSSHALSFLKKYLPFNKARGMASELSIEASLKALLSSIGGAYTSGAWLLSPMSRRNTRDRIAVFVLPELFLDEAELDTAIKRKENNVIAQKLFQFLTNGGFGVLVSGAVFNGDENPEGYGWQHYKLDGEVLVKLPDGSPFKNWWGDKASVLEAGKSQWDADVNTRFSNLNPAQLTGLTLRQAFYHGYLKKRLQKPIIESFDVDGFIVTPSNQVLPVEIKEKTPFNASKLDFDLPSFGLDVGRVMMLLRMCLPNNSNALYIINEVGEKPDRKQMGVLYVTLSDFLMECAWRTMAGGAGMYDDPDKSTTVTLVVPYKVFRNLKRDPLTSIWLAENASLINASQNTGVSAAEKALKVL